MEHRSRTTSRPWPFAGSICEIAPAIFPGGLASGSPTRLGSTRWGEEQTTIREEMHEAVAIGRGTGCTHTSLRVGPNQPDDTHRQHEWGLLSARQCNFGHSRQVDA